MSDTGTVLEQGLNSQQRNFVDLLKGGGATAMPPLPSTPSVTMPPVPPTPTPSVTMPPLPSTPSPSITLPPVPPTPTPSVTVPTTPTPSVTLPPLPPDPHKADYEKRRAGLKLDEEAARRIGDTPADLKDLRDAFIRSADATKVLADGAKWSEAVASLTQFETDLKAALKLRRKNMADATKLAVQGVKTKLNVTTSGGEKAWADVGSDEWKEAVDAICAVQLDEDFTARYDEMNKAAAAAIAADPVIQNAHKKWSEWTADPAALTTNAAEIEAFMNKVLEIQSKITGIDPATQTETFNDTNPNADCGSFDPVSKKLKVNVGIRAFTDFRELLDTLTHENTHAYQTKIIEAYKDGTLAEDDPAYNAAIALAMNENAGYVTPEESDDYPGKDAYTTQCCEAHAWGAGAAAGKAAFNLLEQSATAQPSTGATGP